LIIFPEDRRGELLSWFDAQVFGQTTGSSTRADSVDRNLEEVDDLIERMFQTGVSHPPSTPASADATKLPMQALATDQASEPVAADNELEQPVEHHPRPKRKGKKVTRGQK